MTNKFRDCERNLKMFRDIYFEDQIDVMEKELKASVPYKTIGLLTVFALILLVFGDLKELKWLFPYIVIFIIYWKSERDNMKRNLKFLKEGRNSLIDIERSVKLLRRIE